MITNAGEDEIIDVEICASFKAGNKNTFVRVKRNQSAVCYRFERFCFHSMFCRKINKKIVMQNGHSAVMSLLLSFLQVSCTESYSLAVQHFLVYLSTGTTFFALTLDFRSLVEAVADDFRSLVGLPVGLTPPSRDFISSYCAFHVS